MFLHNAFALFLSFASISLYARALETEPIQLAMALDSLFENCLAATEDRDGAAVVIEPCKPLTAFNSWVIPNGVSGGLGTIQIFGDKCLDVPNGIDANGTKLQIWTCAHKNANQMWVPIGADAGIVWSGKNKCVDVTNGNFTRGNRAQIWECFRKDDNQRFDFLDIDFVLQGAPKSRAIFLTEDTDLCVTASAHAAGAPVVVDKCVDGSTSQAWSDPMGKGQLAIGNLCITPVNDGIKEGTKLVLEPCSAKKTDQVWAFKDDVINLSLANPKMCLDLTNGHKTAGNQLQIWTCAEFTDMADNKNQDWTSIIF